MEMKNASKASKKRQKLHCEKCNFTCSRKCDFNRHCKTKKHNGNFGTNVEMDNYQCSCGKVYKTKSGLWKHKNICKFLENETIQSNPDENGNMLTNVDKMLTNVDKNTACENVIIWECHCGKIYKHRQSLSIHKKQCAEMGQSIIQPHPQNNIKLLSNMFVQIVKENKELREMMVEQSEVAMKQNEKLLEIASKPRMKNTQNNFNVLNYLNTECKNAMNLSDMVEQMEFNFSDLEYLGEHGFVKSIENTFIKQLKNMDQTMRPIHCTDVKRKSMFVKNDGEWFRDTNNLQMDSMVGAINEKQFRAFSKHYNSHPDWGEYDDRAFDLRNQMIQHMCGYIEAMKPKLNSKVLKMIVPHTILNKE